MARTSVGSDRVSERASGPADLRSISGRDEELRRLEDALREAASGRGRVVLVVGDAGIGKSTLVDALGDVANRNGVRVAPGRCWEAGGAPAYWPWVQALRATLSLPGVSEDLKSVQPFLDVVATLVPEVAGPRRPSRPDAIEGDHERFMLFDAISRVIQAAAASQPLLITLDDLHAADLPSLLLLRFVARDVRASRCLIVGAYREREAQLDPSVNEMLGEVGREGEVVTLGGLDTAALDSVLRRTAGAAPSDALLTSLHQITDGNPFYATEIVRLLLREGRLEPRLDLTRRALPVPDSVSDTVLRRVRGLDPQVQTTLQMAAVLGREFSLSPLAAVADLDPADLRRELTVAENEKIVRTTGSGAYIFDHGLIREALYESLPDKERAAIHGRVASVLEASGVETSGENLTEIAHHYLRAALDDARPPYEYAVRAGWRALDVFAYEQATELFEEALALGPLVGASAEEKSRLLQGLGEALLRSGRITEAKERLVAAADHARAAGSSELMAATAITYGYVPVEGGIVNEEQIQLIEDALAMLPSGPSRERGLLLARWGHELMLSGKQADVEPRHRMSSESLEMIRKTGDLRDVARVLRNRFSVIFSPDTLEECLELADEIVQVGLATRDPEIEIIGRIRRGAVLMCQGRAAKLDAELTATRRLADQVRQPLYVSPVAFFKSCITGMRGDVASATKDSDAALAVGPEVPNAMGAHLLQHITWRWQTDGGGDFEPFIRVAMEQRPGIRRTWGAAMAATLARSGRPHEAAALVRDSVDDLPNAPVDSTYIALLHCTTDAMRLLRDPAGAQVLYPALLPYRDQHMVQVMVSPVVYYGAVEWDLGTLAALMEWWDDAELHLEAALEHHARMGARTQLAWTQVELAEVLTRRGREKDAARARALLEEAQRTAQALDLRILTQWAAPSFASLTEAVPAPIPGRRAPGRAAMVKEGDYVTISYGDEVVRLRHSKGLTYLAALLSSPGRELHVLEVASPGSAGPDALGEKLSVASDDAGAILDPAAKSAYKIRIADLRQEIEEADAFNDTARVERAKEELDFITQELAGAVGLGGRDRKAQSNAERARVNVTKRIKSTVDKISEGAGSLGRHLEATIKTGTYLSYSDRLEPTLEWEVQLEPPQKT